MGHPQPKPHPEHDPKGQQGDESIKAGALADGFQNSAVNDTEVDDGSTGYVGVGNGDKFSNNDTDYQSNNDILSNNDTDVDVDVDYEDNDDSSTNDNNHDNAYNWQYQDNSQDNDQDNDTDNSVDVAVGDIAVDIADSFNSSDDDTDDNSDDDIGDLDHVHDFANLGSAGDDLDMDIGDDFSFDLDAEGILNHSLNGEGNDTGFSIIQANSLSDQDTASNITMNNGGATNNVNANGGHAFADEGLDISGGGGGGPGGPPFMTFRGGEGHDGNDDPSSNWTINVGDDMTSESLAYASASVTDSGFHMEVIQGANLAYNAVDVSVVGGSSYLTDVGEDGTDGGAV